jgi:UDP-N-acetylglucosamine transferase subunit ALG13
MILLSVGTQIPFDRLVRTVDEWAIETGRDDIMAQIGPSSYTPKMLKCFSFMRPDEFRDLQSKAELIIAHAGMGSILTALEFGKPILIMPRDHKRAEHRNGHQMATADRFRGRPGVYVVNDEADLLAHLRDFSKLTAPDNLPKKAPESLTSNLRGYIEGLPTKRA